MTNRCDVCGKFTAPRDFHMEWDPIMYMDGSVDEREYYVCHRHEAGGDRSGGVVECAF